MTTRRTVAVLGPIPFDRVTTHRGDVLEKYGCALYTVAALSALLEPTTGSVRSCTSANRTRTPIKAAAVPVPQRRPHRHPLAHSTAATSSS